MAGAKVGKMAVANQWSGPDMGALSDRSEKGEGSDQPSTPEVEFREFFEATPGLYLVLDPALNIRAVIDAYCRATMSIRDVFLCRPLFEVFPDNPDDAGADGARYL